MSNFNIYFHTLSIYRSDSLKIYFVSYSPILVIAEHNTIRRQDGTTSFECLTQAVTFWQIAFFVMVIVLLYALPLIILIVLYSIIAKNLITAASKVVMNKTVDPYNTRARKQVILMLGTVVLCFFLCLMPYRLLALWIIVTPHETMQEVSPEIFYNLLYFSRIMLYINSAINPILYNLMSSKFRIGFCKVFICYKRSSERIQNRRAKRTITNGSTTSSSFTRTTNSLKKLFSHRGSVDKSDAETESKESKDDKANFFERIFTNKRFIRQQSAPVCVNVKPKVNRMRSEGNVCEISDADNKRYTKGDSAKFIDHSNSTKNTDVEERNRGSLRRSVLINTAKSKSTEDRKKQSYQKIPVDSLRSKTMEYEFPESFV